MDVGVRVGATQRGQSWGSFPGQIVPDFQITETISRFSRVFFRHQVGLSRHLTAVLSVNWVPSSCVSFYNDFHLQVCPTDT